MAGKSAEIASAIYLADSSFEMIVDAATVLKDAGEVEGYDELIGLADQLSKAIEKIRARKAEIDGAERLNENDTG